MNPGFQVGPVSFHYYGLILGLAILISFLTAKIVATRQKFPQNIIEELAIILIIPVILGARAYHVLHNWGFYAKNPVQIFFIWQGGIGVIGAIMAGITTLFIYSKLKKLDFLVLADLTTPALALAQAIGRFGNFVNSEAFGPPTNLPWGIYIDPVRRPENLANFSNFHPTFFYEAIGDFLIFLIVIFLPGKLAGVKFALYLILYSILRAGLEFLRIDTWQVGIIKVAQLFSIIGFLAGATILIKLKWTSKSLS